MTKISILTINDWVVLDVYFIGTPIWRRNNVYICVNGVNVICDINEGLCLTDMIRLGEIETYICKNIYILHTLRVSPTYGAVLGCLMRIYITVWLKKHPCTRRKYFLISFRCTWNYLCLWSLCILLCIIVCGYVISHARENDHPSVWRVTISLR